MPVFLADVAAVLLIVIALLGLLKRPLTRTRRLWTTALFLLAGISFGVLGQIAPGRFVKSKTDRSSVVARLISISVEGPQRQLVFHYEVENTTNHPFRIDPAPCSTVSFRFAEKTLDVAAPRRPLNPALDVLEKDSRAYAKFTGLERLAAAHPALTLDPCPLELLPKQSRMVAIAIPYAYPAAIKQNPSADDLKLYLSAFMPQVEGFAIFDPGRNYEIHFPRAW